MRPNEGVVRPIDHGEPGTGDAVMEHVRIDFSLGCAGRLGRPTHPNNN